MMDWFNEKEFGDLSDAFVDDLLNPIDFSLLDIDVDDDDDIDTTNGEVEDWGAKLKYLEPPPMDVFTSFPSEFKLGRVGTVPCLKHESGAANSVPDTKVSKMFQSLSPVSVLERSVASFSPPNSTRSQRLTSPVKGMRSKRKRRPTALRFKYLHQFEANKTEKSTRAESGTKTYYDFEQQAKKKRKIDSARKCSHCETTETPQWREGPNGPKTLCNACGVRFRSGRLVPEYRPASSPTFIPFVHSNSHKKITEMRRKESGQFHTSVIQGVISRA